LPKRWRRPSALNSSTTPPKKSWKFGSKRCQLRRLFARPTRHRVVALRDLLQAQDVEVGHRARAVYDPFGADAHRI